jgi:hypothetical protein
VWGRISPQCRSPTRKLGDIARAENRRNPEGVSSLGHLSASCLSYSPFFGMRLCHSTDICPKQPTRDMRGYFNSLLGQNRPFALSAATSGCRTENLKQPRTRFARMFL